MNKFSKIAIAAALAFGVATSAFATQPGAAAAGGVTIGNTISGQVHLTGGNQTSESQAMNAQSATATISATSSNTPNYSNVAANVAGSTSTTSQGYAWNVSSGGAVGQASSQGYAAAAVGGVIGIHDVGAAGGYSGAGSTNDIQSTTNQAGYNNSTTSSNFGAGLTYSNTQPSIGGVSNQQITVSDTKTGDVYASNSSGAMQIGTGKDLNGNTTYANTGNAGVNNGQSIGAFGAAATATAVTVQTSGDVGVALTGAPVVLSTLNGSL